MDSLHLLYHELRSTPSSYSYVLPAEDFERHCELFARLQQPTSNTLRPEITFDDGHLSNHSLALPILQRHNLHAHFFITAAWTGRRAGFMGWPELRALDAAGHHIGAHGMTHKLLTHCSRAELDNELRGARLLLEDGLGRPITTMSLPGGRSNPAVLEACWAAGYTEVFTSVPRATPATRPPRSLVGRLNVRSSTPTLWLEEVLRPESGLLHKLQLQDSIKSTAKTLLGDRLYARLWSALNRQEPEPDADLDPHAPETPAR